MPREGYAGGYLSDVKDLNEKKIDSTHRSYMDQGQQWLDEHEDKIANGEDRETVIQGVRDTLISQMQAENETSRVDAVSFASEHDNFDNKELIPLIEKMKSKSRKVAIAKAEYQLAISRYRGKHVEEAASSVEKIIRIKKGEEAPEPRKRRSSDLAFLVRPTLRRRLEPPKIQPPLIQQPVKKPDSLSQPPQVQAEVKPQTEQLPPPNEAEAKPQTEQAGLKPQTEQLPPPNETELKVQTEQTELKIQTEQTELKEQAELKEQTELKKQTEEQNEEQNKEQIEPKEQNEPKEPPEDPKKQNEAKEEQRDVEESDIDLNWLEMNPGNPEDLQTDLDTLNKILEKIQENQGSLRSKRYVSFLKLDEQVRRARLAADKLEREADRSEKTIMDKAEEWNTRRRNAYREGTFRKHYKAYDDLAMGYYTMTRKLAGTEERELEEGAVKSIAEYVGIYQPKQIRSIAAVVRDYPYFTTPKIMHVPNRKLGEGSQNTMDSEKLIKYHHMMTFESFAEGIDNVLDETDANAPRVRMKMNAAFKGYKARRQFSAEDHKKLVEREGASNEEKKEDQLIDSSEANLVADEKGTNGELLFSESSAKIHQAKTGLIRGKTVNGMVVGGRFISSDQDTLVSMDDAGLFHSYREKRLSDEERVRTAIRRSDFFRHVNAATIQIYEGYGAKAAFAKSIKTTEYQTKATTILQQEDEKREKREALDQASADLDEGSLDEETEKALVEEYEDLTKDEREAEKKKAEAEHPGEIELDDFSEKKLTPEMIAKLKEQVKEGSPSVVTAVDEVFTYLTSEPRTGIARFNSSEDALADELVKKNLGLALGDKKAAVDLAVMLLAQDDPVCWGVAKEIATKLGGRYQRKLTYLPAEGETMRMGLMTEFTTDRSFDFFDLSKSLRPDRLNMYMEDLEARRGGFFSADHIKQSFFNGSMFSPVADLFSATVKDSGTMGWAKNQDFSAVFNKFNMNYLNLMSDCTTMGYSVAFLPAATIATLAGGKDTGLTAMTAMNTVKLFYTLVTTIKKIIELAKNPKAGKKQKALGITSMCIACLELISNMLYIWTSKLPKAVNNVVNPFFNVMIMIRSVFNIIQDTINIATTTMLINKIDKTDKEMATGMTDFQEERKRLAAENPGTYTPAQSIREEDLEKTSSKAALASIKSAQFSHFNRLSRSRASRERKMSGHDIATSGIKFATGASGFSAAVGGGVLVLPLHLMAMGSKFVGWVHGKLHDSNAFMEQIGATMGDKSLAWAAGFDAALKRETGINNKHYLMDLARVFMAIDTHAMIQKPGKSTGEEALAITAMQPYLNMAGEGDERFTGENLKKNRELLRSLPLQSLMVSVGAPANWRAVLRNSIS